MGHPQNTRDKMWNILKIGQRLVHPCRGVIHNRINKQQVQSIIPVGSDSHINICCRLKSNGANSKDKDEAAIPNINSKYEVFTNDTATIILDVEEERDKILSGQLDVEIERSKVDPLDEFSTTREYNQLLFHMFFVYSSCAYVAGGVTGVFDIEDLVTLLKQDNAENVFVCTVPEHLKYVDYLCVITARSHRHMHAIAEFVLKMYKAKRNKKDLMPRLEGKNSSDWIALDLGNIALHIFSAKTRAQYDIEMLWSVGAEFDTETNKPADPIFELFDQHSSMFNPQSNTDTDRTTTTQHS